MVLKGFQRMGGTLVLPDIVGESSWLPALELYGEGVFFSLDEDLLSRWESHPTLSERSSDFQRRFAATGLRFDPEIIVTPRFLLLHTLAHLLIRQLETEAGYPAASLKERIYCTRRQVAHVGHSGLCGGARCSGLFWAGLPNLPHRSGFCSCCPAYLTMQNGAHLTRCVLNMAAKDQACSTVQPAMHAH